MAISKEAFEQLVLEVAAQQSMQLQSSCGCSECRKRDAPKIVEFARALIKRVEEESVVHSLTFDPPDEKFGQSLIKLPFVSE